MIQTPRPRGVHPVDGNGPGNFLLESTISSQYFLPSDAGNPAVMYSTLDRKQLTIGHVPTVALDVPHWPELVWPNGTYERGAEVTLPVVFVL